MLAGAIQNGWLSDSVILECAVAALVQTESGLTLQKPKTQGNELSSQRKDNTACNYWRGHKWINVCAGVGWTKVSIFDQQQAGQAASWAGFFLRCTRGVMCMQWTNLRQSLLSSMEPKALPCYRDEIHDTGMLIFDKEDFDIGTQSSIKNRCNAVNIYSARTS